MKLFGNNKNNGVTFVSTNFNVLNENIKYIKKIHSYARYKENTNIMDGSFMDYGCGKCRVIYNAYLIGFKNIIGVEFSKKLFEIGKVNINKLITDDSTKVNLILEDASNISPEKDTSVIFLYNPFNENVMKKVIENILKIDYQINPYIVYVNPECKDLFIENKEIEFIGTFISKKAGDVSDI